MLKRLIEVALPLKEVSEQSAREKSIRHGHISTLHIWWARRPLAACRAIVFASLIPDPDDPECPEEFRRQVKELLSRSEFRPKNGNGSTVEDTPRNRCLEFIKYLVRWENSNNPEYIEPARKLIAAAHPILHPDSHSDSPKVLDPFAGGGAIPLEALRLGCDSHALELNPVAHLIELCTLVYPQKYGQPDSRPVPDYIKRLVAHNRLKRKAKGERDLFDDDDPISTAGEGEVVPDMEITVDEYRTNPFAVDVEYWASWVRDNAHDELQALYHSSDGREPILYFWSRTIECLNPTCRKSYPLITDLTLAKRKNSTDIRASLYAAKANSTATLCADGKNAGQPTMQGGGTSCPFCKHPLKAKDLRKYGVDHQGFGERMFAVCTLGSSGRKEYISPNKADDAAWTAAVAVNKTLGVDAVPTEAIANIKGRFNIYIYGYRHWGHLFNARQQVALACLGRWIVEAHERIKALADREYATAVASLLMCVYGRQIDYLSSFCRWVANGEFVAATLGGEKKLPMIWDYAEVNPFAGGPGSWNSATEWVIRVVRELGVLSTPGHVIQGDARRIPFETRSLDCVITDPPYYSAIPYSDLSDFFYTWERRTIRKMFNGKFTSPVTPKRSEITELADLCEEYEYKDRTFFESEMRNAFHDWASKLADSSLMTVVFAHKTTTAWDALIAALLGAGYCPVASWPIHTERPGRNQANNKAALASSIFITCRKRTEDADDGLWDDVRQELKDVAKERLDYFWGQGIRGADFFISAIGPALSVYGRYARVIRLSGEEVTVGEFLDEVRSLVTGYALTKILHTTNTANIDPESRFYVVWKWSYGDGKVSADESFKLAQALGIDTEEMWDKTGVLTKSGENVQCLPVEKRMKTKDLGEPAADGTPASLIDVLHRLCVFRDKGDSAGMAEFLGHSGQARNPALWLVAQAISETLPDGNKEKQLMQGLLNQQEGLEEATREGKLF